MDSPGMTTEEEQQKKEDYYLASQWRLMDESSESIHLPESVL